MWTLCCSILGLILWKDCIKHNFKVYKLTSFSIPMLNSSDWLYSLIHGKISVPEVCVIFTSFWWSKISCLCTTFYLFLMAWISMFCFDEINRCFKKINMISFQGYLFGCAWFRLKMSFNMECGRKMRILPYFLVWNINLFLF